MICLLRDVSHKGHLSSLCWLAVPMLLRSNNLNRSILSVSAKVFQTILLNSQAVFCSAALDSHQMPPSCVPRLYSGTRKLLPEGMVRNTKSNVGKHLSNGDTPSQTPRQLILDSDYEGDDSSSSAEHFYHNICNKELRATNNSSCSSGTNKQ